MMKRICLMTWFRGTNFGTLLQAYALTKKLSDLGYRVTLPDGIAEHYPFKHYLILFCSYLCITQIKDWIEGRNRVPKIFKRRIALIDRWRKQNLPIKRCRFVHEITAIRNSNDLFVSGSDQIWNTYFEFNPAMFLSFANDKKKIAYASSIGTETVNPLFASEVKRLLSSFSHISVREARGAQVLKELTGRTDIATVLDPTLLLTRDEWLSVAGKSKLTIPTEPYILCYLIGDNPHYNEYLQKIKRKSDITRILWIPAQESPNLLIDNAEIVSDIDPFDFVSLLNGASLVCTDSFHATAFAINLQKDFVVLLRFDDADKKSQNSRIYDLLGTNGLSDKIYSSQAENWTSKAAATTDGVFLEKAREHSLSFLTNALKN